MLGSLQLDFAKSEKERFSALVSEHINEQVMYRSNVVPYINGNVCKDLHMTLHFGQIEPTDSQTYENVPLPDKITIADVVIKPGYMSLYNIICLHTEPSHELLFARAKLLRSVGISVSEYDFDGHITLCYTQSTFHDLEALKAQVLKHHSTLTSSGYSAS
jgi:hypothetical protein